MGRVMWCVMALFVCCPLFGSVQPPSTSPDGQWLVEMIGSPDGHGTKWELYSTPAVGGVRRKISGVTPTDNDVADFAISPDSRRVVFRKGRTATGDWQLYSVPIGGGGVVLLSVGMAYTESGYTIPGDVHFRATATAGAALVPWVSRITGGMPMPPAIFADGFNDQTTGAWR